MLTPDVPALISVWWSIDKRYEFLKFLRIFWRVRAAQDFLLSFLALRSESAADRCDFSFRHGGRGRRTFRGETKNETGSKSVEGKRRERDLLATRGESDFAFGEHRRRLSREKPVIGRWRVRRRSLPPARWSQDKKGELLSRPPGERSRDGNPGEGCSSSGRSLLSCRPSSQIVFLELRQRHDNRHRSAINILTSSTNGWTTVCLVISHNFGASTVTKDRLVICFTLFFALF